MGLVRHLVDEMPRPDTHAYHTPTPLQEQHMATAFRLIERGDLDGASATAKPLDYDVVRYTDTGTGRTLVLLRERQRPDGSWPHAWGTYVFSPRSSSKLAVEVPHALDDIDSWIVGVDTFRLANAADLFLAGASRFAGSEGSADMAHQYHSVFEAIHSVVVSHPGTVVFEPHGFEATGHAGYGDLVVSDGTSMPDRIAQSVAAALRTAGFTVCLYDGEQCSGLGGTTNTQGQTILPGDHFLHIEMDPRIRRSPALARQVAEVIARVAG
jgi:hypothetical protein